MFFKEENRICNYYKINTGIFIYFFIVKTILLFQIELTLVLIALDNYLIKKMFSCIIQAFNYKH